MEASRERDRNPDIESQQFAGKRLYRPGVLAAYCIIANLPFGIFLYGLNVYRRGHLWMGRIILAVSAVAITALSAAVASGAKVYSIPSLLLNIVVGIGLMKAERGSYQKAILNGATPARWWPPLLFLAAISLAMFIVSWFSSPDE